MKDWKEFNEAKKITPKFTFKTVTPTGKWKSFDKNQYLIKYNNEEVGRITDNEWKIKLTIIKDDINSDGNPNCTWKWITLGKKSESLQEAKDFLNQNIDKILEKYNLYCQVD